MRKSYKIFAGIAAIVVVAALALGNSGLYKGSLKDPSDTKPSTKCDVLFQQCFNIKIGFTGKKERNTEACSKYEKMCKVEQATSPVPAQFTVPSLSIDASASIPLQILNTYQQHVASFTISAPRYEPITVNRISFRCSGNFPGTVSLNEIQLQDRYTGARLTTLPFPYPAACSNIFGAGSRNLVFSTPLSIPAAGVKTIKVLMDTNTFGEQWQWSAGQNISISIPEEGLSWHYTKNGPSSGPYTVANGYPVQGPWLYREGF